MFSQGCTQSLGKGGGGLRGWYASISFIIFVDHITMGYSRKNPNRGAVEDILF